MRTYRIPLKEWRKQFFDAAPPALATLKKHINAGKLPGEEIGEGTGIIIIHCDGQYNPVWPKGKNPTPSTGSAIADSILKKHAQT